MEDNSNNNKLESMNNSSEDVKIMVNIPMYDDTIDQDEFVVNPQDKRKEKKRCPDCFIF